VEGRVGVGVLCRPPLPHPKLAEVRVRAVIRRHLSHQAHMRVRACICAPVHLYVCVNVRAGVRAHVRP
jgi:hypothetical protein